MNQGSLASFHEYITTDKCRTILALCGAGLSASSGLPTFRGSGGLWKNYSSMDLATPDAFNVDPGLVWQFYSYRRYKAIQAKPNNGHYALSQLSKVAASKGKKFLTLTQNVDGLSRRAHHDPEQLLELHGSLFTLKCTSFDCTYTENNNFKHPLTPQLQGCEEEWINPRKRQRRTENENENENENEDGKDAVISTTGSPEFTPVKEIPRSGLPTCPQCKTGLLRPGVVWFGESLPFKVLDQADQFIMSQKVDLILVIGTSQSVWPAAGYVNRVKLQGGKVAIFNTDEEDLEGCDGWKFLGDAAELLPQALKPLIGDITEVVENDKE
ncbi:hypothetical protein PP7435_CHR2-0050 [Komagataella phaffii CBS 7435]|uniref:NAD-dependent protein deacylase n=2 Tax=Komagataella phaffii TaxID=460519 RepID=C4R311_KOMPG|nr:NAD(+)-dependent histone deacetylase [Komagataella phaffii GS115]AOA62288.1 GQ67_01303T0 [Komagataella phaffii]CAH2447556.1 hypothetical protein BQ9382_C2-0250 [Komagataella phaffii CBS 7435]AOA67274.1 GQ68_00087T0 [Komagataella phaffii GS115]CAY69885.1 NAD(+)-dependent histone deacetylase [Komagataella phaffii GS115]CCA37747.1 hypothetical protein PP7435_CHR2-0050 [Komagataella phaffii CBS 7435]